MSLTRKTFFSGLAAILVAKAQTIITPCRPKLQWGNQIPLCNGQCPNPDCGYRAEPFTKKTYSTELDPKTGLFILNPDYAKLISKGEVFWENSDYGSWKLIPRVRLNRCPNCNTAFWQDPEPEAK